MPKTIFSSEENIDDKLAGFVDQVLAADSGEIEMSEQDLEFQKLEETVLLLHRAVREVQVPPREMQERIKANLIDAWNETGDADRPSLLQGLLGWIKANQRQLVFASSALAILIIGVLAFPAISSSNLFGSAGTVPGESSSTITTIGILLGLMLLSGVIIWLVLRSKK